MPQMQLKEVPQGATVYFVMGDFDVGKGSLINYLMGHDFTYHKGLFNKIRVKDIGKPHADISDPPADSVFDSFDTFPLSDEVYLCELPSEYIGIIQSQKDIDELEKLIADKSINSKILLVSSSSYFESRGGANHWSGMLKVWGDFIEKHQDEILYVMNNKGNTGLPYRYYQSKLENLLEYYDFLAAEEEYKLVSEVVNKQMRNLIKLVDESNTVVWTESSDPRARDLLLPKLIGVKPENYLTASSPKAQQSLFFKAKRVIHHTSHGKPHEHDFELHRVEGKEPHIDVGYPEGFALVTQVASEEEMGMAFDDPDYRTPGTLAVLKSCKGNYAMTLDFATKLYLEMAKTDKQVASETQANMTP